MIPANSGFPLTLGIGVPYSDRALKSTRENCMHEKATEDKKLQLALARTSRATLLSLRNRLQRELEVLDVTLNVLERLIDTMDLSSQKEHEQP